MMRLDLVQRTMEREAQTNIIFLDACRDNPLSRNLARAMGTRSAEIGRGLAPVESGVGTLISFSTQPGNVALDGAGRNSPFASALARHIRSSRDDLGAILIAVRNDVMMETQRRQVPWEHSSLTDRFYFGPPPRPPAPADRPPAAAIVTEAERAWALIKDSKALSDFEAFRLQYGKANSFYRQLAEKRIEELKKEAAQAKAQAEAEAKRQRNERIVAEKKASENAKREADEAATKKRAEKAAEAKAQAEAEAEAEAKRQRDENVAKEGKAAGSGWRGGRSGQSDAGSYVFVRPWVRRPYYGTIVGGVALGTLITVAAIGAVPPRAAPNFCWYWDDPYGSRGYWDYCY